VFARLTWSKKKLKDSVVAWAASLSVQYSLVSQSAPNVIEQTFFLYVFHFSELISAWFKAYQVTIFGCSLILLATVLVQLALGVFICLKALLVAVKKDSRRMEERLGPVVRDRGWFHFFRM
jgi:hypothetical protein